MNSTSLVHKSIAGVSRWRVSAPATLVAVLVILNSIDLSRFMASASFVQPALKAAFALVALTYCLIWSPTLWARSKRNVWLLGYVALAAVSGLWAADLYGWAAGMGSLLTVTAISLSISAHADVERELKRGLFSGFLAIIIVSLMVAVVAPEIAYDFMDQKLRYAGVTYGAHSVARAAAFAMALMVYAAIDESGIDRRRKIATLILMAPICLWTIFATDSRQAQIMLFIIPLFAPRSPVTRLAALVALGLAACVTWLLWPGATDAMAALLQRNTIDDLLTVSSRTVIWSYVLDWSSFSWIGGVGFGGTASFLTSTVYNASGWTTPSTHNAVLQAWLELGVVGALLIAFVLMRNLIASVLMKDRFLGYAFVSIFLLSLVEQGIGGAPDYLLLIAIVGMVGGHVMRISCRRDR